MIKDKEKGWYANIRSASSCVCMKPTAELPEPVYHQVGAGETFDGMIV